jgi:aspartate/methionine/tyrosine aminotransferase
MKAIPQVSNRGASAPFIAMEVMREAAVLAAQGGAHGKRIIQLAVGQPSTGAPHLVREAAARALGKSRLGYTDSMGILKLREAIARHYDEHYGQSVSPDRIIVTSGSSGGFVLAFLACFEAGARVAIAEPCYPAYRNILKSLGLEVVGIPVGAETRWNLTPELIARAESRHGRISGVLVASPGNPTGTMLDAVHLAALAQACEAEGRWFISDEIYHGISYGMAETTALAHSPDALVINSFSKYYSMTGWRLGWLIAPPRMMVPLDRLAQNLFISPAALSQEAAIVAFDATEELDANVAVYAANRKLLLEELPKAGFDNFAPADGAFYLYTDISRFLRPGGNADSTEFCKRMLREIGVAVTPGHDFDTTRGGQTVRFSFSGATADMAEAAERIKAWLA